MQKWLSFLLSISCVSAAVAESPPAVDEQGAAALVTRELLEPLEKAEARRSSFSRVARAPAQRRVRVLVTSAQADARGERFVRFAIDVRYGWNQAGTWTLAAMEGCAYVEQKKVFLLRGDGYVLARSFLRGDEEAQPDACRAPPDGPAKTARAAL